MNVAPPDQPEEVTEIEGTDTTQEPEEKKAREVKAQDSTLQRSNPNIINK